MRIGHDAIPEHKAYNGVDVVKSDSGFDWNHESKLILCNIRITL